MILLEDISWPTARIAEAFDALVGHTGFPLRQDPLPDSPSFTKAEAKRDVALLGTLAESWLRAAGRARGVEVDDVSPTFGDIEAFLGRAGPAIIVTTASETPRLLLLLGASLGQVRLIDAQLRLLRLPLAEVSRVLVVSSLDVDLSFRSLLDELGLSVVEATRVMTLMARDRSAALPVALSWMVRIPPSAPFLLQLRHAKVGAEVVRMVGAVLVQALLSLGAWLSLGSDALSGRVDHGRLIAWALLLLSTVPVTAFITQAQGALALRLAVLSKRQMLQGCLALPIDHVRTSGMGTMLALISEADAIEGLAIGVGFTMLSSVINVASAGTLLLRSNSSGLLLPLLVLWVGMMALGLRTFYQRRSAWTDHRLRLTDDLIAKMVGHRTRLAQQTRDHWHDGEDEMLADYTKGSRAMDRITVALQSAPRLWMFAGSLILLPSIISQTQASSLPLAMVGLLLSFQAMQGALQGMNSLANFALAWRNTRGLIAAATTVDTRPVAVLPRVGDGRVVQQGPVIELFDVVYRYRPTGQPVLRGCEVQIFPGDRVLLEGPSGGGKSTLAAIIAGLRNPESGLVLVAGFDQHTLNREVWRSIVATAPQFHENHIFASSLAFNLLLGRRWPPSGKDLEEAMAVCYELGLGPLVERMSNGLYQLVGESGWQLSQGERSRVYIARALLQRAELLILDESFGALDPETLELCVACVLRHARALAVIAHP
jgi:ATP-binding cassette subfamily B protein